jgi:hypothetical protein
MLVQKHTSAESCKEIIRRAIVASSRCRQQIIGHTYPASSELQTRLGVYIREVERENFVTLRSRDSMKITVKACQRVQIQTAL